MALFIKEQSPERLVLNGRPVYTWVVGFFFAVNGLLGIFVSVNETRFICERDGETGHCVFVPRSDALSPADAIEFDLAEWQDIRVDSTGNSGRVRLVLVDKTYLLFSYDSSDDPSRVDERINEVKSFFHDTSEDKLEFILGNRLKATLGFGGVSLLGILLVLLGPLRRVTFDGRAKQLKVRRRLLFFVKEETWSFSEIEGVHLTSEVVKTSQMTHYNVEIETNYGLMIKLCTGGPLRKRRAQVCDEIKEFFAGLDDGEVEGSETPSW